MRCIYLAFFVFFTACGVHKEYVDAEFIHIKSNARRQSRIIYSVKLPKGYKLSISQASGEVGLEHQYWYPDSSVIYISDMGSGLNQENIKNREYSSPKFEFIIAQNELDTMNISGRDNKGLYWREIIIGNIEFGYLNVSENKKIMFDIVLNSLKEK